MSGRTLIRAHTEFDGWRSMSISLYMALVGYGVMVGIPVISTAWVSLLGFSEVEVGRVAGADLGGLAVGAVVTSLFIARVDRRLLVMLSAAIAMLANALCMSLVEYEQVLWLRLMAGFGSGIYTAVAIATLGATAKPARAFNLMLFAFAFSQALELHVLPQLSMNGIYLVFIACYALTLLFVGWMPPGPLEKRLAPGLDLADVDEGTSPGEPGTVPRFVPWLVLGAIAATYINIGAYWTYIELASADRSISSADADWVGRVLVWASFLSLLGCLFATITSNRFGLARPLLATLVVHSIVVGMLASGINNVNILVSVFMFNFLWIFVDVYQMATIANFDPSGRFASLMPAAQGLGQLIGPNAAATVLAFGLGYSGVFILCASATMTAMLLYATMYLRLVRRVPALANAS
ncbi:MAG TPA: MFS transporter [Woeseiaceae bacterium]|nr:MFS transporter [Woeseiaceae bacterium]